MSFVRGLTPCRSAASGGHCSGDSVRCVHAARRLQRRLAISLAQFNLSTTQTDCFIAVGEDNGPTFVAARRREDFESRVVIELEEKIAGILSEGSLPDQAIRKNLNGARCRINGLRQSEPLTVVSTGRVNSTTGHDTPQSVSAKTPAAQQIEPPKDWFYDADLRDPPSDHPTEIWR